MLDRDSDAPQRRTDPTTGPGGPAEQEQLVLRRVRAEEAAWFEQLATLRTEHRPPSTP